MNRPAKPTLASIKNFTTTDQVKVAMKHVFQDAQTGESGHRKLIIVMKHIFHKSINMNQLDFFMVFFTKLLNRILVLKKGDTYGDRISKFCSVLIRSLNQDELEKKQINEDDEVQLREQESYIAKFTEFLINHLLRGIDSKDKSVRYRVVQLLSFMIDYISEIHEHIVHVLYSSLEKRLQDKESFIRIVATIAIAKFQKYEIKIEDRGTVHDLTAQLQEKLIHLSKYDESPDVRRAAFLNLNKTSVNLPSILERAKDINPTNRRLIYSRISRELDGIERYGEYREFLLKWGLNDRDGSVLAAATKMLCSNWFESVEKDVLEFVELLNPRESMIAEKALSIFLETKPDIVKEIKIEQKFWTELTIEKAFLMRTFFDHCNANRLYDLIDSNFPESIELAQTLENYLKLRIEILQKNKDLVNAWQFHKTNIEKLNDRLYFLENEMNRLKYEGDDSERKVGANERLINQAEIIIEVITKRIQQLTSKKGEVKDLINEETEFVIDSITDLTEIELKKALNGTKANLKELKETQLNLISVFENIKNEFYKYEEEVVTVKETKKIETEKFQQDDKHDYAAFEDTINDLEFIILQVLLLSIEFDFSDEIGRRKMLQLIRTTLTDDKLPTNLISTALKVLKKISINEKDFVSMSVEIITDIRDSSDEDVFHSAANTFDEDAEMNVPKEAPDELYLRCLIVTQHVLELVEEPLDQHLSLGSIYSGIVNYALTKNETESLHILALKCLGLYAIIDKEIAKAAIHSFLKFIRTSNDKVKIIGIKSIIDILSTYGITILTKEEKFKYSRLFYKALISRSPNLQCAIAEGLCKLFLADVFNSEEIPNDLDFQSENGLFEALILSYFHPSIDENKNLKQILAFCIPVYSFSKSNHQLRLASVSGEVIYRLFDEDNNFINYNDYEKELFIEKLNSVSPKNVLTQLINWCDPRNLVEPDLKSTSHYWQLVYFLEVLEQDSTKVVKKAILNSLSSFYISEKLDTNLLTSLKKSLLDTKKILDESKNDEFQLDLKTRKNLDLFIESIEQKLAIAIEIEDKSNTNSILQDLSIYESAPENNASGTNFEKSEAQTPRSETDEAQTPRSETEEAQTTRSETEEAQTPRSESTDTQIPRVENEEEGEKDQPMTSDQAKDLQDIDKLLEDEDNVDYDISMIE